MALQALQSLSAVDEVVKEFDKLVARRSLLYWITKPWRDWRADVRERREQHKLHLIGYLRFAYDNAVCDQFYSLWQSKSGRRKARFLGDYPLIYVSKHHLSQRLKAWLDGDPGVLDAWIEQDMRVREDNRQKNNP